MKMSEEKMKTAWLFDDSIIKRSFAVLGYSTLAWLMVYGVILGIAIVFGGVAALFD